VRSHRILALAAVALLLVAQVRAEDEAAPAEEGSAGCPFTLSLPWTFENETVVDLSEKVQVEGEDNPLAVSTVCTCPASEEIPTVCTCEGPKSDDCDPYAQILAGFFLFAEKFMGIFMHMGEFAAKYHIENVAFWAILGTIFTWIGLIIVLYSEIKAVIITRERDERQRLIDGGFLSKVDAKIGELESREDGALAPRPYLTIGGSILFWVGMLCQFIPFCNILGLIFPGLDMFQGLCFVFVIIGTLILSISTFLFIVGLCWSCTRGWAALVLIVVALLGDVMIFGGLISIIVWVVLASAVLYVYFGFLPNFIKEQGTSSDYARFVQPLGLGEWYKVGLTVDEWKDASTKGYDAAVAESKDFVKSMPGGKETLEAAEKAAEAARKAAEDAAEAAKKNMPSLPSGEAAPAQSGSM